MAARAYARINMAHKAKVMPTATVMVISPPWSVDVMTVDGGLR